MINIEANSTTYKIIYKKVSTITINILKTFLRAYNSVANASQKQEIHRSFILNMAMVLLKECLKNFTELIEPGG